MGAAVAGKVVNPPSSRAVTSNCRANYMHLDCPDARRHPRSAAFLPSPAHLLCGTVCDSRAAARDRSSCRRPRSAGPFSAALDGLSRPGRSQLDRHPPSLEMPSLRSSASRWSTASPAAASRRCAAMFARIERGTARIRWRRRGVDPRAAQATRRQGSVVHAPCVPPSTSRRCRSRAGGADRGTSACDRHACGHGPGLIVLDDVWDFGCF